VRGVPRHRGEEHGGGGGGHDGAGSMRWLLTYADLITLLMVFFVVLYSISVINQQKYIALSASLRSSFLMTRSSGDAAIQTSQTPSAVPRNQPDNASQTGLLEALGNRIQAQAAERGLSQDVHVSVTPEGLRVSFQAESVFFAKAQADITPAFQQLLLAVAPLLQPLPNQIQVQGYTDDEPLHSALYATSWELSAARAVNVLRFLSERGGVDPHKLSAVAFGEYHPLYSNATPEGQARNRSVDLLVLRQAAAGGG
jgi:chemotaxis protein MotB